MPTTIRHHPLNISDLWVLHHKEASAKNYPAFSALWRKEQARVRALPTSAPDGGTQPGLLRPIWQHVGADVTKAAFVLILGVVVQFARPLLMQQILLAVEDSPDAVFTRDRAWVLAILIAVTAMIDVLSECHYNMMVMKAAWRLRQGLVGLLFSKVTRLSLGTKASYSQGKITNMMSSDVDRLRNCVREINQTWTIPLRFAIALFLVIQILGPVPATAGLVVMVLLVPVTRKFLRYSKAFQKTIMQHTDERVRQTQEVRPPIFSSCLFH